MKLIWCAECRRVLSLHHEVEICRCGKSGGRYLEDGLHAEIWGPCTPLGFANYSFVEALNNQPDGGGRGEVFVAFVIEKNCPTVRVLDPPPVITNTPR